MARLNINATNFQTTLAAGFTQDQFITFIKNNLATCGFPTPVETVGTNPKILAYDLQISAHAKNRYWYVIHIPTFTTTFTVTHGLFEYSLYNTTTFTRTINFVGASDNQAVGSQLPSATSYSLNNANSYTAYNFPTSLEYRGVGLRANSTGNLICFLGVTYPETIFNHINRNTTCTLGLILNNSVIASFDANQVSIRIPHPFNNSQSPINGQHINVISHIYPNQLSYISGGVELITSGLYVWNLSMGSTASVGKYSNDIAYGTLGSFPFGSIIQISPGSEEYFVMSSTNPGWAIRILN